MEAERITFNERRCGAAVRTQRKRADYYWNVNKQSAHVLDEIRKAFAEGDQKKAERLTCENFNSEVPYESYRENPFRFGNFTTAGEFYVETGLSAVGDEYRRELSLDSARVLMQFKKDGVKYQRTSFISYPANVLVMRFAASEKGKQNLTFSYAPIRYLPARFRRKERMGWVYRAVG